MRHIRPLIKRDFGRIVTETPFNATWVNAIKYVIPQQHRKYEGGNMWSFDSGYYTCVKAIIEFYFGTAYTDATGGVQGQQVIGWKEAWAVWTSDTPRPKQEKHETPPPPKKGKSSSALFATLFVAENAPKEVIKAAYRALCVTHHPDKGGDTETMARINAAYTELEKQGKA